MLSFEAKPYAFAFPLEKTALLVIDMQRDFICEGGFGQIQGGNLSAVQASIHPTEQLLQACRDAGMVVFHTREGHVSDLSDVPSSKLIRQASSPVNKQHVKVIGDNGELGRLLVRGEYGHDLVDELQPLPGEVVIDKPGKGSFWNTPILRKLKGRGITHLIVAGVTTECCFATSIREANDRGFETCGIVEATAGYNPDFKTASLDMINWSEGLFGFVAHLEPVLHALSAFKLPIPDMATPPQTPKVWDGKLDLASLQKSYRDGLSPETVVEAVFDRIEKYHKVDPAVWILLQEKQKVLDTARNLTLRFPDTSRLPPLFGVPFNVKDSINVAGLPTTTACPPLSYIPAESARCYELVRDQGAIFFGKVNLDQLATGLSGCRSPYGITHSVFSDKHISGGSSSGSCVSVGAGLATFSLATDTAGSGRIPAAYNGVVGYKPTRGLISFEGVTPACLSLDCIAIMTGNVADARSIWQILEEFDDRDRYARDTFPAERHVNALGKQARSFKFGIPPPDILNLCSSTYKDLFNQTIQKLQDLGGKLQRIDYTPFAQAERLLYAGSFVSERLANLLDDFLDRNKANLHPVILELFEAVVARHSSAVQAYRDLQSKALYTRQATVQYRSAARDGIDVLIVPTAPQHPTIEAILADPIHLNASLGIFSHFGNILDLCAVAIPVTKYSLDGVELPLSITLLGARCTDAEVLAIAKQIEEAFVTG